jgi:nucleotide-binding universal stress UspA family protein
LRGAQAQKENVMSRFKHILASTDLSPESFAAVAYAGHLAKSDGAKLTVVHVPHSTSLAYTDFVPPIDMMNIDTAIEDAARAELEGWVARHLKGLRKVEVVLRGGVTHEVICRLAAEIGASVLVMATHGRKGLGHLLLGSVTERVLRDAPCPVLVVKPPAGSGKPRARAKRKSR